MGRPALIYGASSDAPMSQATHLAAAAWSFHYAKRLLETIFVHRFSNATMPLGNLFKNCSYYWGFAAGSAAVEVSEAEVTASVVGSGEGAEDVEDSVAVVEDQAEKAAHETSHFLFYQHHQINVFGKCFNTNCYLFSIKSSI